jgi:hypothetical protein
MFYNIPASMVSVQFFNPNIAGKGISGGQEKFLYGNFRNFNGTLQVDIRIDSQQESNGETENKQGDIIPKKPPYSHGCILAILFFLLDQKYGTKPGPLQYIGHCLDLTHKTTPSGPGNHRLISFTASARAEAMAYMLVTLPTASLSLIL